MTLETIHSCFSGNTKSTTDHRNTEMYCLVRNEGEHDGIPEYKVVDFTVTTNGHICLILENM